MDHVGVADSTHGMLVLTNQDVLDRVVVLLCHDALYKVPYLVTFGATLWASSLWFVIRLSEFSMHGDPNEKKR